MTSDEKLRRQAPQNGERIRHKREAVGWTRRQFSAVCGASEVTIKAVEAYGHTLSAETIAKVEACLDAAPAGASVAARKEGK